MKLLAHKLVAVCSFATLVATDAFSQASPIGGLVHSTELPSHLLIFSPDTATQILSNPSRGALYGRQFVYSTYIPGYSYFYSGYEIVILPANPRKFQAASLLQSNDGYLLMQAGNILSGVSTNDHDQSTWEVSYPYERITTDYVSDEMRQSNTNSYEARITSIQSEQGSGYAYGFYGMYSPANESIELESRNVSNYYDPTTNFLRRTNSQLSTGDDTRDNPYFQVGLEYSCVDAETDLILATEWIRFSSKFDRVSHSEFLSDDLLYQTRSKSTTDELTDNKGVSNTLRVRGLYRMGANLADSPGHWVFAGSASYGFGDDEYNTDRITRNEYTSGGSTSVNEQIIQEQSEIDHTSFQADGLLAFAFQKHWDDMQLLAGPTLNVFYRKSEEDGKRSEYRREYSTTYANIVPSPFGGGSRQYGAGLLVPLFVQVTVVQGFSLFGGMTANWSLYKSSSAWHEELRDSSAKVVRMSDSEFSSMGRSSSQSVYLGMDLRHSGGLNLQVKFRENLASIKEWSISLGYLF